MKLSERLEKYNLVLKQLDLCQKELFDSGFITAPDQRKLENFIDDERARVDRMLKAFGIPPSSVPIGIPTLDAANKVARGNGT